MVRGIDVVGPEEEEAGRAAALLRHEVFHGGDGLLVGRRAGVEDVLAQLLALVLHRVEEQAVQLLEHREHRLPRDRGPAAEDRGDLVLGQQLAGLLGEQRPVGGRVDHHRLDLLPQEAALGVELVDGHQRDVLQRGLADRHRPGEGVEDSDLDGLLGARGASRRRSRAHASAASPMLLVIVRLLRPDSAGRPRLQAMDQVGACRLHSERGTADIPLARRRCRPDRDRRQSCRGPGEPSGVAERRCDARRLVVTRLARHNCQIRASGDEFVPAAVARGTARPEGHGSRRARSRSRRCENRPATETFPHAGLRASRIRRARC